MFYKLRKKVKSVELTAKGITCVFEATDMFGAKHKVTRSGEIQPPTYIFGQDYYTVATPNVYGIMQLAIEGGIETDRGIRIMVSSIALKKATETLLSYYVSKRYILFPPVIKYTKSILARRVQ